MSDIYLHYHSKIFGYLSWDFNFNTEWYTMIYPSWLISIYSRIILNYEINLESISCFFLFKELYFFKLFNLDNY